MFIRNEKPKANKRDPQDKLRPIYGDGMKIRYWLYVEDHARGNAPAAQGQSAASLITYVKDRPGHDRRYTINAHKIMAELGYAPQESFKTGIRKTIQWYLIMKVGGGRRWAAVISTGSSASMLEQMIAEVALAGLAVRKSTCHGVWARGSNTAAATFLVAQASS